MPNIRPLFVFFPVFFLSINPLPNETGGSSLFLVIRIILAIWVSIYLVTVLYANHERIIFWCFYPLGYGIPFLAGQKMLDLKINREAWRINEYRRAMQRVERNIKKHPASQGQSKAKAIEKINHWKHQIKVHSTKRELYWEEKKELRGQHQELFFLRNLYDELDQHLYFYWFLCVPYRLEADPNHYNRLFDGIQRWMIGFSKDQNSKGCEKYRNRINSTKK